MNIAVSILLLLALASSAFAGERTRVRPVLIVLSESAKRTVNVVDALEAAIKAHAEGQVKRITTRLLKEENTEAISFLKQDLQWWKERAKGPSVVPQWAEMLVILEREEDVCVFFLERDNGFYGKDGSVEGFASGIEPYVCYLERGTYSEIPADKVLRPVVAPQVNIYETSAPWDIFFTEYPKDDRFVDPLDVRTKREKQEAVSDEFRP